MSLPEKCVVDTNVPKTANLAISPDLRSEAPCACVLACVEAVEHVIKKRGLIIDAGDEIFAEYRRQLAMRGQPGVGDRFMKWAHDNRWGLPDAQRVKITKSGASYREFPRRAGLDDFDLSDRKFIAVANAHPDKPPVLQATDSEWWGWKDVLQNAGVRVHFLCQEYVRDKYARKMQTK